MRSDQRGTTHFDWEGLYAALDRIRQDRGLTWKAVSAETGISASTLSRLPRGHRPDLESLLRLVEWANLDLNAFARYGERSPSPSLPQLLAALHNDPKLNPEAATHLSDLISAAYRLAVGKG